MLNWHPCVYLYQNAVSCLLSWYENVTNQESNNVCCDLILHSIILIYILNLYLKDSVLSAVFLDTDNK